VRALALEHWHSDAFAVYGEVLAERGIPVDRVVVGDVASLPDWRDYDLIVAMGGPMGVYEEARYPWLVPEKQTIRAAVAAGVPFFGVCFGAQLLASALGAEVYRGPAPELGLSPVFLTEASRRDPVFRGFPRDLEVFEWHQDAFDLPPDAVCLARSPRYANQAMRVGRVAYGIQCHFEKSAEDVGRSLEVMPELLDDLIRRYGERSIEEFLEGYAAFVPFLQETARQLLRRWLELTSAIGGTAPARPQVSDRSLGEGLIARGAEQDRIERFLAEARQGRSGAIVIRGEAGLGKTALLNWAIERANGMQILHSVGAKTDSELAFTALNDFCGTLFERLDRPPPVRSEALAAVLGLRDGTGPGDRFAVYSAFFDLLAEVAEEAPILLVVDDVHWLDEASAEALAFVVRRGAPARTALMFGAEGDAFAVEGAAELPLGRLDDRSMRTLLERHRTVPLDGAVADRVLRAAAGNPLALLELPFALTPEQRLGLEGSESVLHARASAEEAFVYRIARLSFAARHAVLLAALDEDASLQTLARACRELSLDVSAFDEAEDAGLLSVNETHIAFRHPTVRSAAVYGASLADRRAAHAALAQALVGPSTADRHAWHQARAASAPDEQSAATLTEAAGRARDRQAHGTAARAFELAARLTPGPDDRARRLLSAAEAAYFAGHVSAALDHLDAARLDATDAGLLTEIAHLRGRIAARMGSAAAARDVLVAAADRCEQQDERRAALMLADAVIPCLRSGRPGEAVELGYRAQRLAERADRGTRIRSRLMLGTALIFTGDFAEGRERVSAAADLAESLSDLSGELRAYLGRGLRLAGYRERALAVLEELVATARAEGSLGLLPYALARLADLELERGRWSEASSILDEAIQLARETGQSADEGLALGTLGWLDAAQGRDLDCRAHVAAARHTAARLGTGSQLDRAGPALGLLDLGNGRPRPAIRHLEEVLRQQDDQGWSDASVTPHASCDLIEAYILDERSAAASELLRSFEADAERAGRASALAGVARCRGLLAHVDEFERWFASSLAHGESEVSAFDRARTSLRFSERLDEIGERDRAREQAALALKAFERLGARPWAEQARMCFARSE
jgi:GMP synthase-like glutamine amidotransferase/tetratricopeptide (TPR) repeat protein